MNIPFFNLNIKKGRQRELFFSKLYNDRLQIISYFNKNSFFIEKDKKLEKNLQEQKALSAAEKS